jgi:hypothetical protein
MRLLHVPDIAKPLLQFFMKFGDTEEKSSAVISLMATCLRQESSDDSSEYLYNTCFTMTLLSSNTLLFRNAVHSTDVNTLVLDLIHKSLPSKNEKFSVPKWMTPALLLLSTQFQIPRKYTEADPIITLLDLVEMEIIHTMR